VRTDGDFDSGDSDYTRLERDDSSSTRDDAQNCRRMTFCETPFGIMISARLHTVTRWTAGAAPSAKVNP
jgi:hypothetical protein